MKKFALRLPMVISMMLATGLGSVSAQTFDEIAQLQNTRSLADGKLYRYLDSPDPGERARAEIALANIQDTSSIPHLLPLLSDPDPIVRRNCSFALGQIGGAQSAVPLFTRLRNESDIRCCEATLEALGKCGTKDDLKLLISAAGSFSRVLQSAASLCVARFAIRKVKDSAATEYVAHLVGDSAAGPWATYALMRIADSDAVTRHLSVLLKNMNDRSPEARMWTATILGASADPAAVNMVLMHAESDPDWRVRVNAVRSMQKFPGERTAQLLLNLTRDKDEHVALAAYSVLNSGKVRYDAQSLVALSTRTLNDTGSFSWRRRGEAAMLLAKNLRDGSIPMFTSRLGSPPPLRAKIIEALGETKSMAAVPIIARELSDEDRRVVIAAINAYQGIAAGADSAAQAEFCQRVIPLLQRRDFSISSSVVGSFEDTSIQRSLRRKYMPTLMAFFKTISSPADDDIGTELIGIFAELAVDSTASVLERTVSSGDERLARAAAKTLEAMTGRRYEESLARFKPQPIMYRKQDFALVHQFHFADLTTTKGKIKLRFRADAAPFTVMNFILLAEKHYYDHLLFHRVVSNFVIQGGDPEGTGFGGPGYAIKTETYPGADYTEGGVGMASSGKDTEGSQFFITHCPTPHLDGRYTLFAYTADKDVVDQIQMGDEIISVELRE